MKYTVIANQDTLEFLLSCSARDQRKAAKALYDLAENPQQMGDHEEPDAVGRLLQVKRTGPYLVKWWVDDWAREIRVVLVRKLRVNR